MLKNKEATFDDLQTNANADNSEIEHKNKE
jgi:hypothetical protein